MSKQLKLLIQKMLVVKGSNFVHGMKFLRIFQIQIFLFLEYMWITNFSNVTSICPKYYCTQLSCQVTKKIAEKFSFSELIIEKVTFFYSQSDQNFLLWCF